MKPKFFVILSILLTTLAFTPTLFAQDSLWHLPKGATLRLGKGKVGHLEYSPDGTRLAVSSAVGIWLYDAETDEALDLLTGQRGLILWDADTRQHLRTATHILEIIDLVGDTIVALSPDEKKSQVPFNRILVIKSHTLFVCGMWTQDTSSALLTSLNLWVLFKTSNSARMEKQS